MATLELQAPGRTSIDAPGAFIEKLEAISNRPPNVAPVELLELLSSTLGIKVAGKGDVSYHWGPYLPDGKLRGGPRRISTAPVRIDGFDGKPANRVSEQGNFSGKRGLAQYQPVDYQLSINGVVLPPFQHMVQGDVITPTGLRTTGLVPGAVEFKEGFLKVNPQSGKLLHALMELHPQNVGGFMNLARSTGAWPWLQVDIISGEKAMEDWASSRFWFKPEGRDETELKRAQRIESDAKVMAALDNVAVSVMKSIAVSCNVSLPASAIGQADQRPFLVQALKALVESTDPSRDKDRARLADMVGGRHKGIQQRVEEAIKAGAIEVGGGEFVLVEGGDRFPLHGVIVTAGMAGREAEALALAIMQNESLEEFQARMVEATRVAMLRSQPQADTDDGPPVKDMLDRLVELGIIRQDAKNLCWAFKTPDGYDDKVAYFDKHSNGATRFAKLLAWAEGHDHTAARVREAYENVV